MKAKRDWTKADNLTDEQILASAESEPDAAARAYLIVIASNPDAVSKALARLPN
jgi:hypothetical protein